MVVLAEYLPHLANCPHRCHFLSWGKLHVRANWDEGTVVGPPARSNAAARCPPLFLTLTSGCEPDNHLFLLQNGFRQHTHTPSVLHVHDTRKGCQPNHMANKRGLTLLLRKTIATRNSMSFKIALATLKDVGRFQPCLTGRRCPCLLRAYQASSLLHAL